MTWQKSFFRTTLHDLKRRSWCVALLTLVWFFTIPVHQLLIFQSYKYDLAAGALYSKKIPVIQMLFQSVYQFGYNQFGIIIMILASVLLALSGYSYLNSKKKVDFIHSMPIRREALFFSRYVSGILMYMIPLFINVLLGFGVAAANRGMCAKTVVMALGFLLYHLVYFMLFYGTAILAICLCGNFVVSVLGTGVLFVYHTSVMALLQLFRRTFFQTYMSAQDKEKFGFDPVGLLIRQIHSFDDMDYRYYLWSEESINTVSKNYYSVGWKAFLIGLIGVLAVTAIAFFLFRVRASENAGKSIVFRWAEPIIKVAITIPIGLFGGMVMREISMDTNYGMAWYAFGAIVFFLLLSVVMEIVFRQDFKAFFKHKVSVLVSGVIIVIVTLCFRFDLTGFNHFVPKENKIESVGISFPMIESDEYSEKWLYSGAVDRYYGTYNDVEVLENCEITQKEDIEKVLDMAKYCVSNLSFERNLEEDASEQERYEALTIQVVYRMKNGNKIYRYYDMILEDELLAAVDPAYRIAEYKYATNPDLLSEKNYRYLITMGNFARNTKMIAKDDKIELMNCLKKDILDESLYTVMQTSAIGQLFMADSFGNKTTNSFLIYDSYKNTLAYLENLKCTLEDDLSRVNVTGITIDFEDYTGGAYEDYTVSEDYVYQEITVPQDAEKQLEILQNAVRSSYCKSEQNGIDNRFRVMIEYSVSSDKSVDAIEGYYEQYYLKNIPDFIKEQVE